MRIILLLLLLVGILPVCARCESSDWLFGAYLDAAYLNSNNSPENRTWRSKSTTFKLDRIEANMLTGYVRKEASTVSRWGLEFGLQTGVDTDGLTTSAPPPANEPIGNADTWTSLASTTVSYLFPAGDGLMVTGGLLRSYIGYESFHAKDNPNYTRGYLSDGVPYYLWGVQAVYPFNEELTGAFILTTGYNYLTDPNNAPSLGGQLTWQPSKNIKFMENLYFGPDQSDTALEYWRFLTDTIVEWQSGPLLLAAAYNYGSERQAWLSGTPYYKWMSGAIWGRVSIGSTWRLGVRPEFFWNPQGSVTGAQQTLRAIATTLEYRTAVLQYNSLSARLEYRYDRSTGEDGGFFAGPDNHLVPDQSLLIAALMWTFEWQKHEQD